MKKTNAFFYICRNFEKSNIMKYYIFISFFVIFSFSGSAQFFVSVKSNFEVDTLKTCVDTNQTFYAYGIYGTDTVPDMNFIWDFDDNSDIVEGIGMDTVFHTFHDRKAHRILVTVWNDTLWGYNIYPVKIGLEPDFSQTKADIPDGQDGICFGEEVKLIGVADMELWEEERQNVKTEQLEQYIHHNYSYSSVITRRSFYLTDYFTQATDIDSIGLKIEHSNISDLRVVLTCPTGKEVVLKDSGGVEKSFGEPVIEPTDLSPGAGYWYYWSNMPEYGTMNTFSGQDTLPSGSYQADSLWTKFSGCPLNGNWTISVEDVHSNEDNGYIFAWSLYFDEDLERDTIKYSNKINQISWEPASTNDQGIAYVTPPDRGANIYTFNVTNDYGCKDYVDIDVLVESANFEMDKESLRIGDSVQLKNMTTWAEAYKWEFSDDTDDKTEEEVYKKFDYAGEYKINLTVKSQSGCRDTVSKKITVYAEFNEIPDYNIFTPNGDGMNDVFSFFNNPDEEINAANIEQIHGRIYNRYGDVVCKWETTEEAIQGWDGTIDNRGGREAPTGFYYYVLIITTKEKDEKNNFVKNEPFNGTIFLYRSE